MNTYKRHRFPPEIIGYAVWLYYRFSLSHRDIEDLLAERGITVSHESVRLWCNKFGPKYARRLKRKHRGYGDTGSGHSVDWNADHTAWELRDDGMLQDRAARRAQEEYNKAVIAVQQGNESDAAFFLGAMAHYIGDVSQYGHSGPGENHHSDYEGWASSRSEPTDTVFTPFLSESSLVRRTPYTAAKRISRATSGGRDEIQTFAFMDANYASRNSDPVYLASTGSALNMAVNELADVLHTFFLNVVNED